MVPHQGTLKIDDPLFYRKSCFRVMNNELELFICILEKPLVFDSESNSASESESSADDTKKKNNKNKQK